MTNIAIRCTVACVYPRLQDSPGFLLHGFGLNPLPTNDAYMRHELPQAHNNLYKWVRSLRSLHPLGSLRSLQLLRAWLSLASLAQSHGCDEVGKERD